MDAMELERRYSARNYAPLAVVLARGEGAHLWDTAGRRYIDMMSTYSAASHGHAHPRILAALNAQAQRLVVPSRAYFNDRLGPFLAELCRLTGLDAALPMNTGAGAVETAIKAARRWGYRVKGIPRERAEIIVADGNFHGRTTTVISFLDRGRLPRRLWPIHAWFPLGPVRRSCRLRTSHRAQHRRRAGRAHSGRGWHHRAACGIPRRAAPSLRRPSRAAHSR